MPLLAFQHRTTFIILLPSSPLLFSTTFTSKFLNKVYCFNLGFTGHTHNMPGTVQGYGNKNRRRHPWEVCVPSYHGSFFILKQVLNCVAHNKTLKNSDLGKAPSNLNLGFLVFQGLLSSAARPVL